MDCEGTLPCPPVRGDWAPSCDSFINLSVPSSDSRVHLSSQSPDASEGYPSTFQKSNMVKSPNCPSHTIPATVEKDPIDEDQNRITGCQEPTDITSERTPLQSLEAFVENLFNTSKSSSVPENDVSDYSAAGNEYSSSSMNSRGKIKIFKCKFCQATFNTKEDLWMHLRTHIKPDRLLQCDQCTFVTDHNHHLKYHKMNHQGEKPYKCDKCEYKCVNNSMLNSHMKTHSSLHQYRCAKCAFTTKYKHSLKVHLGKHSHQPAEMLNPDGTPNPLPFNDIYGTQRGPKMKITEREQGSQTLPNKRAKRENRKPLMSALLGAVPVMVPPPSMSEDLLQQNTLPSSCTPSTSDEEDWENYKLLYNVEAVYSEDDEPSEVLATTSSVVPNSHQPASTEDLKCEHCCIYFEDFALRKIHMRSHGF